MGNVVEIWRHPIKAHSREKLTRVELIAGQTMPWDRVWAVAHEASNADNSAWSRCSNFTRAAKAPALMAITSQLDETTGVITLFHPDLPDVSFSPDTDPMALINWSAPLVPQNRARSTRIVRVPGIGLTDSNYPSISIGNLASHKAVENQIGHSLSRQRWRTNIWLEGEEPWEEFNWVGRKLRIGTAEFSVRDRITRCMATTSNPDTGIRDAETLGALETGWDHTDFTVACVVIKSGEINITDQIEVL